MNSVKRTRRRLGRKNDHYVRRPGFEPLEDRTLFAIAGPLTASVASLSGPIQVAGGTSSSVPVATTPVATSPPSAPSSTPSGLTPAHLRHAYGYDDIGFANGIIGDGTGQTIAIVDAFQQPNIQSDLTAFDQQFGLPAPPSFQIFTQTGAPDAPFGNWGIEIALDVEWAHAMAPGASILLVEAASAGTDLVSMVDYARKQPGVSVVSSSWGFPEFNGEATYDQYFTTPAGHTGVTFVASAGDQGGGAGTYPAFSPNVLAVGGTMLTTADSQGDYGSESAWPSGGGGISQDEPQPAFQQGVVTQSGTARAIPDVAFDAGTQVPVYDSYDFGATTPWVEDGGTSLGAPSWAALIATADEGTTLAGQGTLAGAATAALLYQIAGLPAGFHDITTGSNGFPAGPGYDLATGLGSPLAPTIAEGLSGDIAAPDPLGPSAVITTSTPTFSWTAVPGAVGYELAATDVTTGFQILDVSVAGASNTSYTSTGAQFVPGHTYTWQIQAEPPLGGISPPSNFVVFMYPQIGTPALLTPVSGATVTTTEPTFQWSKVASASAYAVTIVDVANPNIVVFSSPDDPATSFTPPTALSDAHNYQWTVSAVFTINGVTYPGPASNPSYFFVSQVGAPTKISPANSSTVSTTTPILEWSAVPGAADYLVTLVDLSTNSNPFGELLVTGNTYIPTSDTYNNFTYLNQDLQDGHSYQWDVQAFDSSRNGSGGSPPFEFTVAATGGVTGGLVAPKPIGPSAGTLTTTTPIFSWSSVPNATGYELYVDDLALNTTSVYQVGATAVTLPMPLTNADDFNWWVRAYDSASDVSPSSAPINLAIQANPAPIPAAPIGTVTTATPTFQWSAVPGVATYTLIIDQDYEFSGPPASGTYFGEEIQVTGTSYLSSVPLANGATYQWFVLGGTGSSEVRPTFTIALPAGGGSLPTPSLVGPSGLVGTTMPMFQWRAVPGATSYGLYLENPFTGALVMPPVAVSGTSYTLSTPLLTANTYNWSITAYDGSGDVSAPSRSLYFIDQASNGLGTPTALSPSVSTTTYTTTFTWSAVTGAAGYDLTVIDETSIDPTTNTVSPGIAFTYPLGPITSDSVDNLSNGDTYQWYVAAVNGSGTPGPLSSLTFTLDAPVIGTPTPLEPADGAIVTTTMPKLEWTSVTGAVGYTLLLTDTAVKGATYGLPLTTTSYTPSTPLLNGHTYTWFVAAQVAATVFDGPQSDTFEFTVSVLAPPNLDPFSGPVTTTTPTLNWQSVSGASYYTVLVVDTTTGVTVVAAATVTGTSYTIAIPLNDVDEYQWSVTAYDAVGDSSVESVPGLFTIIPVGTPIPVAYAGADTGPTPTLRWSPAPGDIGYNVYVKDVSAGVKTIINGPAIAQTTYVISTPLNYGDTYQWFVTAHDAAGDVSTPSSPDDFSVAAPPTPLAVPVPSAPSGTVTTTNPMFQWSPASGAAGYEFTVVDITGGGSTIVISPTKVSGSPQTAGEPLTNGHTYEWEVLAYDSSGDLGGYSPALTFTVSSKATPALTWANPAAITYGTPLGPTQLDATANVGGAFTYTPATGTVLGAGAGQILKVSFTPTDTTDYLAVSDQVAINVVKQTPTITWSNPADITFGTPLGPAQLDATANVGGTFTYLPASGVLLGAGPGQPLMVTFTPTDTTDYQPVNDQVAINVVKQTPTITWSNPADITFGTPLGPAQLDATANVGGTFTYLPASGVLLGAGPGQPLMVTFTPSDTADFQSVDDQVAINVVQQTPTITWSNPADITFGTPLGSAQLDAIANVAGAFTYTPPAGTILGAGPGQPLFAKFTPNDTTDYQAVTNQVAINVVAVVKQTPAITWSNPADITFGTPLGPAQLDATANVGGTFTYLPAAGMILVAGPGHPLMVTFTPSDTADFQSVDDQVAINVVQQTPTITWSNPADITFGTPLGPAQLDATANVAGAFIYTPAAGTILGAGPGQPLFAKFTPNDTTDYQAVTNQVAINVVAVVKQTPAITWSNPADITFGTPLGPAQLDATANVGGTFTYLPAAGMILVAGPGQPLMVTFTPSDTADFQSVDDQVAINVVQQTPTITWSNPADITFGTPLGSAQLDAIANVAGAFTYTPPAGTILGAGPGQPLFAKFTPNDTTDYQAVTVQAAINVVAVVKQTPAITWSNPADITFATPLGPAQLDATANVAGTFTYTPAAGTVLGVGQGQTLMATFMPSDTTEDQTVTDEVAINVLAGIIGVSSFFSRKNELTPIIPPIVGGHAYAVVGYNPSSSMPYTVYNPWGTMSSGWAQGTYNGRQVWGQFTANAAFLSQNFSGQSIGAGTAAGLDGHRDGGANPGSADPTGMSSSAHVVGSPLRTTVGYVAAGNSAMPVFQGSLAAQGDFPLTDPLRGVLHKGSKTVTSFDLAT